MERIEGSPVPNHLRGRSAHSDLQATLELPQFGTTCYLTANYCFVAGREGRGPRHLRRHACEASSKDLPVSKQPCSKSLN
jgi:hypothetical protein